MAPSKKEKDLLSVKKRAKELREDARKAKAKAMSRNAVEAKAAAGPAIRRKRTKGVIITSEEVAEVKAKLATAEAADAGAGKKASAKKPAAKKGAAAAVAVAAASAPATPPHRYEVHVKKATITVVVTLHRVPDAAVNIDETTDTKLVVDTKPKADSGLKAAFVKHWRLEFPFPQGMRVASVQGDYTLDRGVLTCVFPIAHMPPEVEAEVNDRLESVRTAQRAKKKTVKVDENAPVMRAKLVELAHSAVHGAPAKKKAKTEAGAAAAEGDADEVPMPAPAAAARDAAVGAKKGRGGEKAAADGEKREPRNPHKKPKVESKDQLLALAAEASKQADDSLKGKLAVARARHQRRTQHEMAAQGRKDARADRQMNAFERVLAEKRAKVAAQAAAATPAPRKPASGTPRKSVSFQK